METITKTKCPDNKRLDFLPLHTGKAFLQYEQAIYHHMDTASEDYSGGFWDYYTLSNGGFYMAWDAEKTLKMENLGNYFDEEMSAEAASIASNLMVQNAFAWQIEAERFSEYFHQLRDYAIQHPEAGKILGFID